MNECPELRLLTIPRWQLFGSFTFKSERLTDRVRDGMWRGFVREVENVARVPERYLLWCCRQERGEVGKRLHFHSLIGGLPSGRIHKGTCFQVMRIWERLGGGWARVRVFSSDTESPDQALGYSLKGLKGDDFYESDKFNRAQLTLSESVLRVVRTACSMTDRSLGTGEKCVPSCSVPVDSSC
jgi:hypothetical protein